MRTRRFIPALLTLALTCGFASADTVKLKSGETFKGKITAEDAASVTIEFEVVKGIKDERRFEKSEIESFQKDDPADAAWEVLTKQIPTADLLGTGDYDTLIASVDKFIADHGKSMRAGEARRLLASLKEERAKVSAGGMKLDGAWITPEEYQREKYWIDGRIALKQMSDLAKAGRNTEALRTFEKIESDYGGTTIAAKAISEANTLVKRYAASVAEAIARNPEVMRQRAAVLTTLAPEERRKTEDLQKAEIASHKEKLAIERKSGTKWLTMAPFDLEELKKAADFADKETKRIATIDTSKAETTEATLRQIDLAIHEGRLEAAAGLLGQVTGNTQGIPYLKVLQDRVKLEQTRAAEAKKAADDARAAAERAARQANPAPVTPKANEEPDPVKEGMNPVAKAVADSELGQRVAGESPAPAAPSPTPAATTATEESTTPAAKETNPPATSDSATGESGKKSAASGFTPILYVVAGVLVLVLIGLLLLPSLKKKPEENTSVLDHKKKQAEPAEGEEPQA